MRRYQKRGIPTLFLIGRNSLIRHQGFGQEEDMALGAIPGSLQAEKAPDMA